MKRIVTLCLTAVALAAVLWAAPTSAADFGSDPSWSGRKAQWFAYQYPWHAQYAHTQYGQPVALVVPPTANAQSHWGWGVGSARMTPIYHQYDRRYRAPGGGANCPFHATPTWPSSTDQFGVYYIRGPW
jgi:hypothetical protein